MQQEQRQGSSDKSYQGASEGKLDDLGGVVTRREGLEGKARATKKSLVCLRNSKESDGRSHTLDSPTTNSFVYYTLTSLKCLSYAKQTWLFLATVY